MHGSPRLTRTFEPHAANVEQVAEILGTARINAKHWPEAFRELLRTPQHLRVFLERVRGTSEGQVFTTYQQMLDDLWQQKVVNLGGPVGRSQLLLDMAAMMSEEECLWLRVGALRKRNRLSSRWYLSGFLMPRQTMARASASNTRRSLSTLVPEHLQGR